MEAIRTTMAAERLISLIDLPRSFYGQDVEVIVLPQGKKQEKSADGEGKIASMYGCMEGKIWIADDFDEPLEDCQPKSMRPPFNFGCMKGKVWMAEDFDAPLEDMKEYME